jgi:hypothetical protein
VEHKNILQVVWQRTEFVKDEYFVYNGENSDNSDHIEKFTHDYFEYEQGHANIR